MKYLMIAFFIMLSMLSCKKDNGSQSQSQDQQQQQQFSDVIIGKPTGATYRANSETTGMRYTFNITINDSTRLKEINCYQQSPTISMWHYVGPWKSGSYSFARVTGSFYAVYYFEVILKNGAKHRFPTWQLE